MAAATNTTRLLQHPSHEHPLEPLDFRIHHQSLPLICKLCRRKISGDAFTCQDCQSYYHRVCVEAPSRIEHHPFHPLHPLPLFQDPGSFGCDACCDYFNSGCSSFRCELCNFDMDLSCALSTLSDQGGSSTPEQITLSLHPHSLTSFSTRHDFVGGTDCVLCKENVERDGYWCLRRPCDFLIHKRCIQDLYYVDGSKAPRVYHGHPLETTIVGEETGSSRCANCGSYASGEFIGCELCEVYIHRDCIQVKDILQYPPHPGHTLVLFINRPDNPKLQCQSCSSSLGGELCYRCFTCEFFVHIKCAHQTLAYCEKGSRVEIKCIWHEHQLILCHRTKSSSDHCFVCERMSNGPTYMCKVQNCEFLIHEQCTELQSIMSHPFHLDHPITQHMEANGHAPDCSACCKIIVGMHFSCELCAFYLHLDCANRVPTHKHYLHEHELLHFDEVPSMECNRCGISTDSRTFRCVPCNFNLHEKCMELPPLVKHETHVHPLTLRETYVEDDSGEYYCDRCGNKRDGRLGVYVCEQCKVTYAFHIECVLPELQKVYVKKSQTSVIKRLAENITRKRGQIHTAEEKLEEVKQEFDELKWALDELKRELEELVQKHAELISEQDRN